MLGHKSVATTQKYLGVNYADVQMGVAAMEITTLKNAVSTDAQRPVYRANDDTLIAELARRGYNNIEKITK